MARKSLTMVSSKKPDLYHLGCLLHHNPFTGEWVAIKDSHRIYSHADIERVKAELEMVYGKEAA